MSGSDFEVTGLEELSSKLMAAVDDFPGTAEKGLITIGNKLKKGDNVKTKQVIGKLSANEKSNSTLNFQVWKDKDKLNPQLWLAPM